MSKLIIEVTDSEIHITKDSTITITYPLEMSLQKIDIDVLGRVKVQFLRQFVNIHTI